MPVITETLTDPSEEPVEGVAVTIQVAGDGGRPIPAAYAADGTLVNRFRTETDDEGIWSVDLPANDTLTPAGTAYRVILTGKRVDSTPRYVTVPATAGPHDVADILTDAPGAIAPPALAAHQADTTDVHGIPDTSALLVTGDVGDTVQAHSADLDTLAAGGKPAALQAIDDGRYAPRPAADGTAGQALKIASLSPLVTEWGDAGGASDDPVFTGDVDASGADSVLVPDGTADGHAVALSAYSASLGQFDIQGNQIGDTGWRNVSASLSNGWTTFDAGYYLLIRRVGNQVFVTGRLNSTSASAIGFYSIPSGFQPHDHGAASSYDGASIDVSSVISGVWQKPVGLSVNNVLSVIAAGTAGTAPNSTDNRITGSWLTDDAWPASLPGSAI